MRRRRALVVTAVVLAAGAAGFGIGAAVGDEPTEGVHVDGGPATTAAPATSAPPAATDTAGEVPAASLTVEPKGDLDDGTTAPSTPSSATRRTRRPGPPVSRAS